MKFGFVLPSGDARLAADYAQQAEAAGWDGFFVWEPVWGFDAWVSLAAAAMRTERIRLGTLLTPLSRMCPWKLASETLSRAHHPGPLPTLAASNRAAAAHPHLGGGRLAAQQVNAAGAAL